MVSGQQHAPAALYPRERRGTHCTGDCVGPRTGLEQAEKSRSHRDSIPDLPARSSVAIPTELPGPRLCVCVCVCVCVCIYIYIYIYMYLFVVCHTAGYILFLKKSPFQGPYRQTGTRSVHVVNVNKLLDFINAKCKFIN